MHFIVFSLFSWILLHPRLSNLTLSAHAHLSREKRSPLVATDIPLPSVSSPRPSSDCNFKEENGLTIYCTEVDIEDLVPNIPKDTVHLEITQSPLRVLENPLFSHLLNLRYLKLSHNEHMFITPHIFQGLDNLEELDLSFNKISFLINVFIHTPNLKVLNLDSNEVYSVRSIAGSLRHLVNFQNLSLSHNIYIRRILSNDFSALNTNLTNLVLFNTNLEVIEEGAFRPFRRLKVLELSVNYLNETSFRNLTVGLKEIEILHIRYVQFQTGLPYEALSLLANSSIQQIDISRNYFPNFRKFPPLRTLTRLVISFCSIENVEPDAFAGTPNLIFLDLHGNHFLSLPEHVFDLPKLISLSLGKQNPVGTMAPLSLPNYIFKNAKELYVIDLGRTPTDGIIRRYAFYGLWKLEGLILLSCSIRRIEDFAFETLVSLKAINLKDNEIDYLTNHTFTGLRSLEAIVLLENKIKFVQGVYPFHNSPLLSDIYMDRNQIVEIPSGMFSRNLLLEELTLSENKIVSWDFTILAPESNVTVLWLSRNKITHITPSMMADFLRVTHVLDVSENPFNCTACGMKDFQRFMNETDTLFLSYPDSTTVIGTYTCSSPAKFEGMLLFSVDIPDWHCFPQEVNTTVFVMTLVLSIVVAVSLVTVFCYASRWYIRYWLFHLKATLKERTEVEGECTRHYTYDAFVCYNASDTSWVTNTLIPALEEQEPRYKLCIHERDFEVGRLITDNILDAIEVSRMVILLLSGSFLASEWCLFELHLAQHRLFEETRDVLVLVKLNDINKKLYTRNLRYLEKTRPCLSWTENPVGKKLFWDKMRRILGQPATDSQEGMTQC